MSIDYYRNGMGLLYEHAATYDGDDDGRDALYYALMDDAHALATTLVSLGVSDGYAFWLASRRVTGSL